MLDVAAKENEVAIDVMSGGAAPVDDGAGLNADRMCARRLSSICDDARSAGAREVLSHGFGLVICPPRAEFVGIVGVCE